jgi:DNA-binding PadR family transcriptional regulator
LTTSRTIGHQQKAILKALNSVETEVTTKDVYNAVGQRYPEASIFLALQRMAKRDLVVRRKGAPLPFRGGKARTYYRIAEAGRRAAATP